MNKKFVVVIFCILYLLFDANLYTMGSKGREFWLAFPYCLTGTSTKYFIIASENNTTGTIEIPGLGFSTDFSVLANNAIMVKLPIGAEMIGADSIENKGIHIIASNEITVIGLSLRWVLTDTFLALPIEMLEKEYIVLSYKNGGGGPGTQFVIAACEDATSITITPSSTTGIRAAGIPYNIMLNAGQAYQLSDRISMTGDLSGTIITSDKPIAVFGSHSCAQVPITVYACNHIVEQMLPVKYWGNEFFSMPFADRFNGDTFRFLASRDNTNIYVNGTLITTLNRSQFFEQVIDMPSYITSDKPILVAQYSHGIEYDNAPFGDPSMMLIMPLNLFGTNYITYTLNNIWFDVNYVNIIISEASLGKITMDGLFLPVNIFNVIGTSSYYGAQISVTEGMHTFTGPEPFGIFAYGFAYADAYSYPGGFNLPTFTITPTHTISPTITATNTITKTNTITPTFTQSFTPTITPTPASFYFKLITNYPNPAKDETNIIYEIGTPANVLVKIFTISGEKLVEISQKGNSGKNVLGWNLKNKYKKDVANGIYIFSIEATAGEEKKEEWGKIAVLR